MRTLKFITLVIVIVTSGLIAFAEPQDVKPEQILEKTVILQQKVNPIRPRVPSRITLECAYGDGYISCNFPESILLISVRLYNNTEEYTDIISQDNPTMLIPSLSGEYYIECETENGHLFVGTLYF